MVELVAKRYGAAIFELAKEQGAVDSLKQEIIAVKDTFMDAEVMDFLTHPKVSLNDKIDLVEKTLTDRISKDLLGLIVLVIKKSRQNVLPQIFDETLALIDEAQGKAKAYISSAEVLSAAQSSKIVEELANLAKKEIIPVYDVDPSLLGGLVIRIGDRIVDNSIKGRLHTLSKSLLESQMTL